MKFNVAKSAVALLMAAFCTVGICALSCDNDVVWILGVVSAITLSVGAVLAMGVDATSRSMVSARVGAMVYFFLSLCVNVVFSFIDFNIPLYLVISGLLLCIFLLIYLNIYNASKEVG